MFEQQLSLDLHIKQDASISDFAGPGWESIIDVVRQMHVGLLQQLYLYGEQDTGKSHLLSAISESFREIGQSVIYLSLRELIDADPMVVSGLETMQVIALDDIEALQGRVNWQEAIFHLINLAHEHQSTLIFASRLPVNQLDFELKDLMSRLAKSPTYQLPSGQNRLDRQLILEAVLKRRNWHFDSRITEHLLNEGPYRVGAMLAVINHLQPLFSNLERTYVTKAKIQEAVSIINDQTLTYELQDLAIDEHDDFLDF
ncbi:MULTISPECIES: DnaA ATPase domain-containing protein [unclassified Moraxella]|uniref:DnaA ATPase domain-containing protein n=1 Tax=unclassified Moraxella TaxID=2685852 RepID=UPI003AF6EE74